MFIKKLKIINVILFLSLLTFVISCNKKVTKKNKIIKIKQVELPNEYIFMTGELKFNKDTIKNLLDEFKDEPALEEIYEIAKEAYYKKLGKPNQKMSLEEFFEQLYKFEKFHKANFWITEKGKAKIQFIGIDLLDILKGLSKDTKINSYKNFKYFYLDKKENIILASKKGITIITFGLDLKNLFLYKRPENSIGLKKVLEKRTQTPDNFHVSFYEDKDIKKMGQEISFLKNFNGASLKVYYNEKIKSNNINLFALLGKEDSVNAANYLNLLYQQYLPIILNVIEMKKEQFINETKSYLTIEQKKDLIEKAKETLRNIKISEDENYLNININIKNITPIQYMMANISILGIVAAIAIPAYQGYIKKSKENAEKIDSDAVNKKNYYIKREKYYLDVKDIENKKVSLKKYKNKVIILDFWGVWCPPCKIMIPKLVNLKKEYGDKIVIIGVHEPSNYPGYKSINKFIKIFKINYPIWIASNEFLQKYKVDSYPTIIIIDKNGKIQHRSIGIDSKEKLKSIIDSLLEK